MKRDDLKRIELDYYEESKDKSIKEINQELEQLNKLFDEYDSKKDSDLYIEIFFRRILAYKKLISLRRKVNSSCINHREENQ